VERVGPTRWLATATESKSVLWTSRSTQCRAQTCCDHIRGRDKFAPRRILTRIVTEPTIRADAISPHRFRWTEIARFQAAAIDHNLVQHHSRIDHEYPEHMRAGVGTRSRTEAETTSLSTLCAHAGEPASAPVVRICGAWSSSATARRRPAPVRIGWVAGDPTRREFARRGETHLEIEPGASVASFVSSTLAAVVGIPRRRHRCVRVRE